MYLTRAYLNPRRDGAQKLITSPQRMHAATLACFPEQPVLTTDSGRVLWRLDADNRHRPVLWIVSPARPDLTHIIEDAGWPKAETGQWESRDYESLLQSLVVGQHYAFRLTANPTQSIPAKRPVTSDPTQPLERRPRGKRVPHVTVSQQIDWLARRSATAGFRLLPASAFLPGTTEQATQVQVSDRTITKFSKEKGKRQVAITHTTFVGALEVADPDAMRTTLCHGIGHARAYGCGLLTLASFPSVAAAS
jgi:CRISPR system Cascade subunit CasE